MTALIEPQSDNEYQSVDSQSVLFYLSPSLSLCEQPFSSSSSAAVVSVGVIYDTETLDTL